MLIAIEESLKYLIEGLAIVIIVSIFFAAIGVHLFRGLFYNRCMYPETGIF
jgi:hypothetical protein